MLRDTRRPLSLIVLATAVVTLAACDSSHRSSTAPSSPPQLFSVGVLPSAGPLDAALAVESYKVRAEGLSSKVYWYRPSLVLTETTGKGPARLTSFQFGADGRVIFFIVNDRPAGTGCFLTPESQQVPAGGSWNSDSLYTYCLDIDSPVQLPSLDVTVTFTDADGREGIARATATVE